MTIIGDQRSVLQQWEQWRPAVERSDITACRSLIARGEKIDIREPSSGWTLLHAAADEGQFAVCELLVKAGADIHTVDHRGNTPLFYAVRSGNVPLCRWLVGLGARTDVVNKRGNTLLHWAASNKQPGACRFLLEPRQSRACPAIREPGIAVDAVSAGGYTALREAVEVDSDDCCRILLGAGANPELRPPDADPDFCLTPFEQAVQSGHVGLANLFLERCEIDPYVPTAAGQTLLELAGDDAPTMKALVYSMMTQWSIKNAVDTANVNSSVPSVPRQSRGTAL